MDAEVQVALELERLRGAVDTGFATLNGRLDGVLQRTDGAEGDIKDLESRVSSLERKVWMAAGVAAVAGAGGATGLFQVMGG